MRLQYSNGYYRPVADVGGYELQRVQIIYGRCQPLLCDVSHVALVLLPEPEIYMDRFGLSEKELTALREEGVI